MNSEDGGYYYTLHDDVAFRWNTKGFLTQE